MDNRHAYLILAHTNPGQLVKLVKMLDDVRNDIYVHIDGRAGFGYEVLEGKCALSPLHFIEPRIDVHWGGFSIIKVEMALLEEAVKTPHSYYHLLSGMDLPIKSQDYIHDFFDANSGKEFLNIWKIKAHTLNRVQYYTLFPEGSRCFLTNLLNHAFKGILRISGIKRNKGIEFKQGSQWFSITDPLAQYIVSHKDWVYKVFGHSCLCDEIFIPTLVWQSPFKDKLFCNDQTEGHEINRSNMRLIDWSRGESVRHPWVFTSDDFKMLQDSPLLWARKFDERIDSAIIDRVAEILQ